MISGSNSLSVGFVGVVVAVVVGYGSNFVVLSHSTVVFHRPPVDCPLPYPEYPMKGRSSLLMPYRQVRQLGLLMTKYSEMVD